MRSEALARFGNAVRLGIDVGERCIAKHGERAQREIAIEEMAELIVAIKHEDRQKGTRADVIEEIADVTLCMIQLALVYGVGEVAGEIARKAARVSEVLNAD